MVLYAACFKLSPQRANQASTWSMKVYVLVYSNFHFENRLIVFLWSYSFLIGVVVDAGQLILIINSDC